MNNNIYPLVSYVILTYNQEKFVQETLEAALAQDYSNLEIIVSDDFSTDRTVEVVRGVINCYTGPHRIILNVNPHNLGIGGHVSTVLTDIAKGDYFILVGGDDIPSPDHTEIAVSAIREDEDVYIVDFSASIIDEAGLSANKYNSVDQILYFNLNDYLLCDNINYFAPGRIVKREVMNAFGGIINDCPTEDTVIVLRSLMLGRCKRVPENVIKYRRTSSSVSIPTNLGSINIAGILTQYQLDAEVAYRLKRIDLEAYRTLKIRLNVDFAYRKLVYFGFRSTWARVPTRLIAKLLIFSFRMAIKLRTWWGNRFS